MAFLFLFSFVVVPNEESMVDFWMGKTKASIDVPTIKISNNLAGIIRF